MLKYSAVLFDFDGVIAHTAPVFRQVMWNFFREREIRVMEEDF